MNEIICRDPFRQKTYCLQEIVIIKQQNAKSVTDASIWVNFISKTKLSYNYPRYGFHFRPTSLADKPHSWDS